MSTGNPPSRSWAARQLIRAQRRPVDPAVADRVRHGQTPISAARRRLPGSGTRPGNIRPPVVIHPDSPPCTPTRLVPFDLSSWAYSVRARRSEFAVKLPDCPRPTASNDHSPGRGPLLAFGERALSRGQKTSISAAPVLPPVDWTTSKRRKRPVKDTGTM